MDIPEEHVIYEDDRPKYTRKYKKPVPVSELMRWDKEQEKPDSWKQMLKKIKFTPPYEGFYGDYPVKPGFHFYKALIEAKIPLKYLTGVNIPDFIINLTKDTYMVS